MKLPYICFRDSVFFPKTSGNIFVDRKSSLHALLLAETQFNKKLVIVTQKKTEKEHPASKADLFSTGTLARMSGFIRLQDGSVQVCFEGLKKFKIEKFDFTETFLVTGLVVQSTSTKPRKMDLSKKMDFIDLFVKANSFVVFDEDLRWLQDWLLLKNETQVADAIQARLKYTNTFGPKTRPWEKKSFKETKIINQRIYLMQMILEASNPAARLEKIRTYLLNEINTGLLKG